MNPTQIIDGNRLIADFLKWEHYGDGMTYKFPNLYPIYHADDSRQTGWISDQISNAQFHTSWDWMRPVVDKIHDELSFHTEWLPRFLDELTIFSTIEQVWKLVIQFIKWHNNLTQF
jgi:hypothetical protein